MTDKLDSTNEIDLAIGLAHGVNAVLMELTKHVLGDNLGPRAEFAAKLISAAKSQDPAVNAYAHPVSDVLFSFATALTTSPEDQRKFDDSIRAIRNPK